MFKQSKLSNGLKLITAPIEGTKTITILLMFATGSKYENKNNNGISHFLEHMFFKGTQKRPDYLILSSELDSLGCEYNAFTAKEYTGYWIKVDAAKQELAMDVLSDMLTASKFDEAEMEREKGVIVEEINMYHENPMMYIEDLFEQCLYGDQPAGWDIAGTKETVKNMKKSDFLDYFYSQYGALKAVLCLAGNINEKTLVLAEKYFSSVKKSEFKEKLVARDEQSAPALKINFKEVDQINISLGVRAYHNEHSDKIALKVLAIILGGSMSSRLFTEVREKRGLAYYVRTSVEAYTDTGYLTTQSGVPMGKQDEAISAILAEYKKIASEPVSEEELRRAKDLIRGRMIIAFEASDDVANWYAKQAAISNKEILDLNKYFEKLEAVSAADILRVAKDIFKNEKLNLAVIGPFKNKEEFEKILKI